MTPKRSLFVGVLIAVLAGIPGVLAQDTEELLKSGLAQLRAGDYQAAWESFDAAAAGAPRHGGARMLRGMAENRLGRHGDALISLTEAESLGLANPQLDFETGWAAVESGLWDRAIAALERHEAAKPGNAKTAEFLARARAGKGEYDAAVALFEEAMRRDPAVRPSALYHLAYLEMQRGDRAAADAYLERLFAEVPDSPLARSLAERLEATREAQRRGAARRQAAAEPTKPWRVGASAALGHNDNVLALPDGMPVPAGGGSRSSLLVSYAADLRYDWRLGDADVLSAGYVLGGAEYFDVAAADYNDHTLFGNWSHALTSDLDLAGRLGYGRTIVDGDSFRTTYSLGASLAYRVGAGALVDFGYGAVISDYDREPADALQDRDALTHTVSVTLNGNMTGKLPGDPLLRLGLAHAWNNAEGRNFDYRAFTVFLSASASLPHDLTLAGSGAISTHGYVHLNSFAFDGVSLFAFDRDDNVKIGSLRLSRPIVDGVEVFLSYRRIDNESNIGFFEYTQDTWSLGLQARF